MLHRLLLCLALYATACHYPAADPSPKSDNKPFVRYPNQWEPKPVKQIVLPSMVLKTLQALAKRDTAAFDSLVRYPIEVRGSLDSDPVLFADAKQFWKEVAPRIRNTRFLRDSSRWKESWRGASHYRIGDYDFKLDQDSILRLSTMYWDIYN